MKFIFLAFVFYLPEHFYHLIKVGRLENHKKYEGGSNVELEEPKELPCFNCLFFFFFNFSKQLVVICCSNLLLRSGECFGPFYWVAKIKMGNNLKSKSLLKN